MAEPDIIPKEALDWLKAKKLSPGFDYRDVWRDEHSIGFTVAKMTNLDLLSDVKSLVEEALAEGQSFAQFREVLKPLLVKRGWWGQQEMNDPLTKESRVVQLGSDRRIRTIYETNMRTARSAGQWERIERTRRAMPYLLYTLGPSREHRAEHLQWADLCLPVDDPFWQTHIGPNGWGCKCGVRQVSKYEYEQMQKNGVTRNVQQLDDNGLPTGQVTRETVPLRTTAPEVKRVKWVNKRTGEEEMVPEGIDPGWDYNPGMARKAELEQQLSQKQAAFDSGN
ncbi:phage protein [Klebsiella sp. WP3-W18-ESBL-02]|uniref:phage head morphogenesis protein n=1 Tax=Klebsiella sp. WP3-W18-ESBL-02 TaxID=2675710 RepID=UPI0015DCB393|nr:phage minor head protein [Klebsiella sp. WP3-W18-ESBL-02]BBQ81697.1 phage protein [Klebsiella sp. WP3-W18-ESBL-02]